MSNLLEFSGAFISGTMITLLLSLFGVVFGFVIGLFICVAKISSNKITKLIATIYVEIIRGTPLIVQISIVAFGLPILGVKYPSLFGLKPEFTAGVIALSMNSAAYIAEIMRSGIQSVDKGQMEASRSLGFNYYETMKYIIIPQAIKNILPALGNEFITLVKESAIVSIVGITDLMFVAASVKNSTYDFFGPYLLVAAIYFVITFSLSRAIAMFEKRLSTN